VTPIQGVETRRFGEWLSEQFRGADVEIYYDHGDKTAHSNVAAIKAFAGERVANANRLADLDVLAAKGDEARLIVEIEERPLSPKKVLGDVLSVMLSDQLAVRIDRRHRYFRLTPRTRLLIAGAVPDAGDRVSKIREIIVPRLKVLSGPPSRLSPERVELFFSGSLAETLEALKRKASEIIGEMV
jgi:hypothetical protein